MNREYDVFERMPSGEFLWRAAVHGKDEALRVMNELAGEGREVVIMHLPTKTVVATSVDSESSAAD